MPCIGQSHFYLLKTPRSFGASRAPLIIFSPLINIVATLLGMRTEQTPALFWIEVRGVGGDGWFCLQVIVSLAKTLNPYLPVMLKQTNCIG